MSRKKPNPLCFLTIEDYAAQGKTIAHTTEGKVVLVHNAIPGDQAQVRIFKNKKDWAEGKVEQIVVASTRRVEPRCTHFGQCGGCKWQSLRYEDQVFFKAKEVVENLKRIGGVDVPQHINTLPCEQQWFYRNHFEYTFSARRYIPTEQLHQPETNVFSPCLGFHPPRLFDKVVNIERCFLMDDAHNDLRNRLRAFCIQNGFSFYDQKLHTGWLRNLRIRTNRQGEMLVGVVVAYEHATSQAKILRFFDEFPAVKHLYWVVNPKKNDSIADLPATVVKGSGTLYETLGRFSFGIDLISFFQTNPAQAERMYSLIREYAFLHAPDNPIIYDLYCGTGTIALCLSEGAKLVIGVEALANAVDNAKKNAQKNHINNVAFVCADLNDKWLLDPYPPADVIVVNPPRAGLSPALIRTIERIQAPIIVYVSCNSATQARDLQTLKTDYTLTHVSVVDMFPHTHHVESVIRLQRT